MASKTPPSRRPAGRKPTRPAQAKASRSSGGGGAKFLAGLGSVYMGSAHLMGRAVRAFSTEKLADSERRDGAPFFVFLLSIFGALFAWFLINESWANAVHSYTFGMLFGLVHSHFLQSFFFTLFTCLGTLLRLRTALVSRLAFGFSCR